MRVISISGPFNHYKQLHVCLGGENYPMGCLLERKAQIIFITASSVKENGKKQKVVIESRPEFAIVRLSGSRERFPIAWESIYEIAKKRQIDNVRLEAQAGRAPKRLKENKPR